MNKEMDDASGGGAAVGDRPSAGAAADAAAPDRAEGGAPDAVEGGAPEFAPGDADGELPDKFYEDAVGIEEGFFGEVDGIGETNGITAAAGTLTAGEWIDNDHYTYWQSLYQSNEAGWEGYSKLWSRTYSSRTFVSTAVNGKPAENVTVTLTNKDGELLWTAKTDNEGRAYLFYAPSELSKGNLTVKTSLGNETAEVTPEKSSIAFNFGKGSAANAKKSLDLALIVDTTGSMGDELKYLQKELESVVSRAAKDNGNIPVRLSVSFYRDDGDEYVVRDFDFTDNISEAIKNLNAQSSEGGGDTPEKVNAALDTAINKLSWSEDSTKLAFIILDAPPHSEDSEAVKQMNSLTEQAAAKGIRLIPILASGGDKETEFLMRDFALKTGGSYLFLTDDSGVSAGQHIEPTIGEYTVEKLNDLMVKVIDRYLKNADKPAEYTDEKVELKKPDADDPQQDSVGGVTMELLKPGARNASFSVINNTKKDYTYGLDFDLEQLNNGQWAKLKPLDDASVIEIAAVLQSGKTNVFDAPVGEYFGELPSGQYRVSLDVSSPEGECLTLYGEFTIE